MSKRKLDEYRNGARHRLTLQERAILIQRLQTDLESDYDGQSVGSDVRQQNGGYEQIFDVLPNLNHSELKDLRIAIDHHLAKMGRIVLTGSQAIGVGDPIHDIEHDAYTRAVLNLKKTYDNYINVIFSGQKFFSCIQEIAKHTAVCKATGDGRTLRGYLISQYNELVGTAKKYIDTVQSAPFDIERI